MSDIGAAPYEPPAPPSRPPTPGPITFGNETFHYDKSHPYANIWHNGRYYLLPQQCHSKSIAAMDEHGPITYMYGLNIKGTTLFTRQPPTLQHDIGHSNYQQIDYRALDNADSQQSTWHPCFQEKKSRTDANHSHQRLLAEKTALDASHARLLAELENERAQAHNAPSQNERRIVNARIRSNESLLQQNRQKAHQKDLEARAAWWRAIGVVIDTSQGDPTNGSWYDTIDPYGVHAQAQYSRVSDVTSNHTLVYSAQPDSGQGETRFYYTGHFAAPWQQY